MISIERTRNHSQGAINIALELLTISRFKESISVPFLAFCGFRESIRYTVFHDPTYIIG